MRLTLTEEQMLLRESVERFIAERYRFDESQASITDRCCCDAETWRFFAEQGWLALPLPEAYGGLGGSPADLAVLMEAFGRGPVLEPFVPVVVIAAGLIELAGSEEQKQELLPAIAEGSARPVFAHVEPRAGEDTPLGVEARRAGDRWTLDGRKTAVLGGYDADQFIVSARIAGAASKPHNIGLFLVPADTPGLERTAYSTLDGAGGADLTLNGVSLPASALLGGSKDARAAIAEIFDRGTAALAAQAVGSIQTLVDMTIDYTQQRIQFGKPLSANQVIRHRIVDMLIACVEGRAIAQHAAQSILAAPADRARAVSSAKWKIATSALFVAEQAVQLHGAMGCTDELAVGRYFRSILAFELLFGSPATHLRRHVALRAAESCMAPEQGNVAA